MDFSKLMLGTVQFGLNYGIANTAGKPSYENARDIIQAAYESGVNCLDTAAGYGDSEAVLGRALAELNLKDKMEVISKVPGISQQNLSESAAERFIVESVENSLARLGIKRLTACLFHVEQDIKYIGILQSLERKGLIGGAGISLDTNQYCNDAIAAGIKYVQLPYNILDKRFDAFFSLAQKNGIVVFARSVYLQGLLLMPEDKIRESLHEVIPIRCKLACLAADAGMDMSELCMRFVLSNPAITSVLTGVDNIEQFKHNLQLIEKGPLSAALQQKIKASIPLLDEKIIRPSLWNKIPPLG
ncbi:MAG: aldo/keto reductase [Victivallaceae bacterium]|jgi:aryl-alcohol dehydrogenase-like predicted oxidoreductase